MRKMNSFNETVIAKDSSIIADNKPVFGIDLGTTNSAISVVANGGTSKIIELRNGKKTMPSCVLWKNGKFIVGDEAYANREDRVCERIPSLLGYKRTLKHKDYDSFDAANILEGYLKYSRDENGNKMICGIIEKSHISFTAYRCINKSDFSADEILTPFQSDDFMEQRIFSQFIPDYLVFNKRFNLHENIRMASSHNRAVVTVVPQRWLKTLMFTYDFIDIRDTSKIVLLYIYAARFFSNSEMNILKHLLPNNEKVYQ